MRNAYKNWGQETYREDLGVDGRIIRDTGT
jgi:hypothetical protein